MRRERRGPRPRRRRRHHRDHGLHRPSRAHARADRGVPRAREASWWSADPTRRSAPRSCAAAATSSSSTRRRRPGRSSCATSQPAPGRRSTGPPRSPTSPRRRCRASTCCKVDRYHALTIQFARGCPFNCEFCDIIVVYGRRPRAKSVAAGDGRDRGVPPARGEAGLPRRRQLHRQQEARQGPAARDRDVERARTATRCTSTPRCRSTWRRTTSCSSCSVPRTSPRSSSASRARGRRRCVETKKTQNLRGDLVGQRPQGPVLRHPGAGRHDRRLRPRRRHHLRGAAALHPGRPHPRVDDRHAAGDAEDAAPRAGGRRGAPDRRVDRRPVRLLEHPAAQHDAARAVPRLPRAGDPAVRLPCLSAAGRWTTCSARGREVASQSRLGARGHAPLHAHHVADRAAGVAATRVVHALAARLHPAATPVGVRRRGVARRHPPGALRLRARAAPRISTAPSRSWKPAKPRRSR